MLCVIRFVNFLSQKSLEVKLKKRKLKEKEYDLRKLNEVQTKVYSYHTKHKHGFLKEEIDDFLLKNYSNINMDKFNDALIGVTGMLVIKGKDKGKLLIYRCDVEKALCCGLENRNLYHFELD